MKPFRGLHAHLEPLADHIGRTDLHLLSRCWRSQHGLRMQGDLHRLTHARYADEHQHAQSFQDLSHLAHSFLETMISSLLLPDTPYFPFPLKTRKKKPESFGRHAHSSRCASMNCFSF